MKAPTPPERAILYFARQPSKRVIECESAAHHMSGSAVDVRRRGVGIELDVAVDGQGRGAALHAIAVALEVDPPQLVGHEVAVVRVQRRVGVEVDHRGAPLSAVANISGSTVISPSWRFQYVHIGRSRSTTSPDGVVMSIASGMPSIDQKRAAHGPGATTTCSPTSIGPALVPTAELGRRRETNPVTSTPRAQRRPRRGTCREAQERTPR